MHIIDDVIFSPTHCTFLLADGPNADLFPFDFPLTRAEIRKKLRVTTRAKAQRVERDRVYVHDSVYNTITDWLVDE